MGDQCYGNVRLNGKTASSRRTGLIIKDPGRVRCVSANAVQIIKKKQNASIGSVQVWIEM